MRPYLEVKIVKVKKEKKYIKKEIIDGRLYKFYYSKKLNLCLTEIKPYPKAKKPKGNWVNDENLDKIKFPCFCSWQIPLDNEINYGELQINNEYCLYRIDKQHHYSNLVEKNQSLEKLIRRWRIHILKGKIIIYEEG